MLGTKRRQFGNIVGHVKGVERHELARRHGPPSSSTRRLSWDDVEWIKKRWGGKLILKGILDAEDAELAVAAAPTRSSSPTTAAASSTARRRRSRRCRRSPARRDRIEVQMDGGIRSGQDVLKALALGAKGMLIGRAFVYGLGAMGEAGVAKSQQYVLGASGRQETYCYRASVYGAANATLMRRSSNVRQLTCGGVPAARHARGGSRWGRPGAGAEAAPCASRPVVAPRGRGRRHATISSRRCGANGRRRPLRRRSHGHISALRKRLGAERIETQPPGYVLRLADEDELDIRRFERAAAEAPAEGRLARRRSSGRRLRSSVASRWPTFATRRSQARMRPGSKSFVWRSLEEQIQAELELGHDEEVVPELERLIAENPLREGLRAQLMLALYRAGRQADALHAFQDARSVLLDELGIDPSPTLQRLEQQILDQDPELAAPDAFAPARHLSAADQPTGIVTFLFTEAEGPAREMVRTVVGQHGGFDVDTDDDSILVAFTRARDAVAAAVGIQRATRQRRSPPDRHQLDGSGLDGRGLRGAGRPRCDEHLECRARRTDPPLADRRVTSFGKRRSTRTTCATSASTD